ncbi:hypothetical protein [Paludisphaera sp.]|uniref:baeRF3 domain-containing protein n=1 Tax=Paludisphaera sp. TaxID=2017432 RepID=UPI00301B8F5E
MSHVTIDDLAGLLKPAASPAISLYQPTHRANPDRLQDPIRFKNLLAAAERSLAEKYPGREIDSLLKPMRDLQDDYQFWSHQEDGLAMFRTPDTFVYYQVQRPVAELVVVADSFHVKPILRMVQSADRFQVLWLDRENFRLFEGNRDVLDEVDLGDLPSTIVEALGEDLTEQHEMAWTPGPARGPQGDPAFHPGIGGRKDERRTDKERFFRFVDRAVEDRFSKPSGQPLILAALPEYQTEFRKLSRNSAILAEGIAVDPGALTVDGLRDRAWKVVEPRYLARLAGLKETFGAADAAGKAVSRVHDAAREAAAGRIGMLMIEADRIVPGRLDLEGGGKVQRTQSLDDPGVDDLLDDVAEAVLRSGGEVVVVPADRMPTDTGLAGVLRY